MDPWKRRFLLETIIFRFHVCFGGCRYRIGYNLFQWLQKTTGHAEAAPKAKAKAEAATAGDPGDGADGEDDSLPGGCGWMAVDGFDD